jgi:hypothetical protein
MEDYATTITDEQRREESSSPSTMELDQPGGSSLDHRCAHGNDEASTSYLRNLPIREVSKSALQIAQAKDQARDPSLNADAPIWEMAQTSPPKPMKPGIYPLECPREEADVLTLLGPASLIASGP